MMNCSGAIDISLDYKTYRIFGDTKIVFSYNFYDIGYVKLLITLLLCI